MFQKILVPLDGSRLSEDALPVVVELVKGTGASVILFAVSEAPEATRRRGAGLARPLPIGLAQPGALPDGVLPTESPRYAETRNQAVERREHELLEYLDTVGRPLVEAGCSVHAAVHVGSPDREIVRFAKEGGFDLILMATHGHSGLRQVVQGSVAAAVLRSGVAPVLLVKPSRRRRRRS